jgi:hypothetical protein
MMVNFRARGISPGARKLTRTPTLIIIKNTELSKIGFISFFGLYKFN